MSVSSPAVYVAVAPSQLSRSVELASAKLYAMTTLAPSTTTVVVAVLV